MANITIPNLPQAIALTGTEQLLGVQSGTSKSITISQISTYVTGSTIVPVANGGTGNSTAASARIALLPDMTANGGKFLRVNAGATDYELATISGGGDALTSGNLGQFAATTH